MCSSTLPPGSSRSAPSSRRRALPPSGPCISGRSSFVELTDRRARPTTACLRVPASIRGEFSAVPDGTALTVSPAGKLTQTVASIRRRVESTRRRVERTLLWQVWERMLEVEFVDRSVALAGKAFVSFFPLVVVVAAFMPTSIRTAIYTTLTHRLGITGDTLTTAKQAFASSKDIRRATGLFGLLLTFFYASSFTTALQRVYTRAWRRPAGAKLGGYVRGPAWLAAFLGYMALMGARARAHLRWRRYHARRRGGAGRFDGVVVADGLVDAPGRREAARPGALRSDHRSGDVALRTLCDDLDAGHRDAKSEPVRLLRGRPGPGHLVLRCRDRHRDRRVPRVRCSPPTVDPSVVSCGVPPTRCSSTARYRHCRPRSVRSASPTPSARRRTSESIVQFGYHGLTSSPANAMDRESSGTWSRGTAISSTVGPTRTATDSSRSRSKP